MFLGEGHWHRKAKWFPARRRKRTRGWELEMLDEAHFEKWNKARQERDCWVEAVKAARDTFGEDHEVTRWARAQLADAEADYGVVVDVLIPSDRAK